jgi:ATP-dependent DNA ligase
MNISPMLAETGDKSYLDRSDYLYEQKLDGVRCIAILNPNLAKTQLQARSGNDITAKFPELSELHRQVAKPAILDGELMGTNFNAIQHRIHQERAFNIRIAQFQYPITYSVFDIISHDYDSLNTVPLIERKAILDKTLTESDTARLLAWRTGDGRELLERTIEQQLEGVMAKHIYSPYLVGKRSSNWLKIKNWKEDTYYICGLTEGENDRATTFGSLILAKRVDGKLVYVGNVGSGLTQDQLRMMLYLLEFMKGECPFEARPDTDRPVKFWTRTELRCEVRYLEVSHNGMLRFPTFRKLVK